VIVCSLDTQYSVRRACIMYRSSPKISESIAACFILCTFAILRLCYGCGECGIASCKAAREARFFSVKDTKTTPRDTGVSSEDFESVVIFALSLNRISVELIATSFQAPPVVPELQRHQQSHRTIHLLTSSIRDPPHLIRLHKHYTTREYLVSQFHDGLLRHIVSALPPSRYQPPNNFIYESPILTKIIHSS
jgi:hypothetical protein